MAKYKKKFVEKDETDETSVDVETDSKDFCCISCAGSEYKHVGEFEKQYYDGIKDGKAFSCIRREIVRCTCGQTAIILTYE